MLRDVCDVIQQIEIWADLELRIFFARQNQRGLGKRDCAVGQGHELLKRFTRSGTHFETSFSSQDGRSAMESITHSGFALRSRSGPYECAMARHRMPAPWAD